MEENMKELNQVFEGVKDYCDKNSIEYLFAAVADDGKFVKISRSTLTHTILKEAAKVLDTLIKTK